MPARLILTVYDLSGAMISRRIANGQKGDHALAWDLGFDYGKPSDGAYAFTLDAVARNGQRARFAPSLLDEAGVRVRIENVKSDLQAGSVSYTLPEPGFVRIVLCEDDVPLRQLQGWKPSPAGAHTFTWPGAKGQQPGKTASSLLFTGLALPPNVIFLRGSDPAPFNPPKRPDPQALSPSKVFYLAEDAAAKAPGPRLQLSFFQQNGDAIQADTPALQVPFQVRMLVDRRDVENLHNERFNLCVYVDGEVLIEEEEGLVPYNFAVDPTALAPGAHYVMVVAISTTGRMGSASRAFMVTKEPSKAPAE